MVRQFSDSISLRNITVWHKICKLTDMIHYTYNTRVYFGKETENEEMTPEHTTSRLEGLNICCLWTIYSLILLYLKI